MVNERQDQANLESVSCRGGRYAQVNAPTDISRMSLIDRRFGLIWPVS
jgi:hypothetical protein